MSSAKVAHSDHIAAKLKSTSKGQKGLVRPTAARKTRSAKRVLGPSMAKAWSVQLCYADLIQKPWGSHRGLTQAGQFSDKLSEETRRKRNKQFDNLMEVEFCSLDQEVQAH